VTRRVHVVSLLVAAIAIGAASTASAQTEVKVVRDASIIWGRDARVPLTTVKIGTVLEVVGEEGAFYAVRVPPENGGRGEVGLIAKMLVEIVEGGASASHAGTPAAASAAASGRGVDTTPRTEWLGFGQVGYSTFLAHETFDAVFGRADAPALGAGIRVNVDGRWFVDGAIDWVSKTGQRVVVVGNEVFPLGISDRIRLLPIAVNAGYRRVGRRATPFAGAGLGVVFFKETSQFADPSENIDDRFASYQAVVGVELGPARSRVRAAVELQFTTVPGALGSSGASAAFNEHNLGGFQLRVKVLAR